RRKLLLETRKQRLIDILVAAGDALSVCEDELFTRGELRARGVVLEIGNLLRTESLLHPTGRVDIHSERAPVQSRDKCVDQIAQARLDIASLLDPLREGRLPFDDGWAIAHEFCRVEYHTQAGLLRLHNLPRGRWCSLDGQLRKSWHGKSPLILCSSHSSSQAILDYNHPFGESKVFCREAHRSVGSAAGSLPYGILHHMPAKLLYRQKFLYPDGAIREMVLWQLPRPTKDRPHGLKYRLYY